MYVIFHISLQVFLGIKISINIKTFNVYYIGILYYFLIINYITLIKIDNFITDTIHDHIENVHGNVELGAQELVKGSNYQSKFRRKVYVLLLLMIIVAIILVVALVIKLS